MWPYTDTEQDWLARSARPSDARPLTPLFTERFMAEARDLRATARNVRGSADAVPDIVVRHGQEHIYRLAEAIAAALVGTASWIGSWFVRPRRHAAGRVNAETNSGTLREDLRQPLTSIRSAAEILRDNPTLAPDQRARMLGLIVAESERLDRMIGASQAPA